jgi:hypothetical protein
MIELRMRRPRNRMHADRIDPPPEVDGSEDLDRAAEEADA